MGVGNFQFSRDEQERQKQIQFFKNMDLEIKKSRFKNEIHKLKRQKILLERLNKVKQRRLLKHGGFTLDQIKEMKNFDSDIDEVEKEIAELERILHDSELLKSYGQQTISGIKLEDLEQNSSINADEAVFERPKRKVILDREWDKPKLSSWFDFYI
jgi:hypothetical protein